MIHRFATTALAVAALFTAGAALAQPAGNGGGMANPTGSKIE